MARTPRTAVVAVLCVLAGTLTVGARRQGPESAASAPAAKAAASPLIGTWVLVSTTGLGTLPKPDGRIRVITETGWRLSSPTGLTGGHYTLADRDYTEFRDYFTGRGGLDAPASTKSTVRVDGAELRMTPSEGGATETWMRLFGTAPGDQPPSLALACEATVLGRSAAPPIGGFPDGGRGLAVAAQAQLQAVVAHQPAGATPYLDMARCYSGMRRPADAATMLDKAMTELRTARANRLGQSAPATAERAPVTLGTTADVPQKRGGVGPGAPPVPVPSSLIVPVILEVTTNRQGGVKEARVIRSVPMFDDDVVKTVRTWQYAPTIVDGAAREAIFPVAVVVGGGNLSRDDIDVARFLNERGAYAAAEMALAPAVLDTTREARKLALGGQRVADGEFGAGAYYPGRGLSNPVLIREVKPAYSEAAMRGKLQGTVLLDAVILADGSIRDIVVTRSLGRGLDEEAVRALRQWQFKPATDSSGMPVSVLVSFQLAFRLH